MFEKITTSIKDVCYVWAQEMKQVFRDEGVLIFFIIVPLVYPLLYSWIYNNERVFDVPVVVVDQSGTALSRQFIRQADASPDVRVLCYANDLEEARSLVSRQVVKGIYLIPADFATRVNRLEPTAVVVYCDMSLMLTYKAIYQTAVAVTQQMGAQVQTQLSGHYTAREEQIQVRPLDFDDVPLFNPTGGYGTFILPGVLMLIIQQTLVLGIGLAAGTARESNRYGDLVPISRPYQSVGNIVTGKALAYLMIYAVMGTYLTLAVPRLFSLTLLVHWRALLAVMVPYLLACIFFGMLVSCLVRYRENVMLLMVFVSVPLLFLSGVSWPQTSIPGFWQGVSWLFPSTFGVRAYVRLGTMGATLADVQQEYRVLWVQAGFYLVMACLLYSHQIRLARRHALERLDYMQRRQAVSTWMRRRQQRTKGKASNR